MKKNQLFSIIAFVCFTAINAQNKPTIDWAEIPAGTFTMGSPESELDRGQDETQHQVTLSAFKMSKYEITYEQYDMFCAATGHKNVGDDKLGRGKRPMVWVSWNDAVAFAEWMDCRLPTEAEWEYACRAGTSTTFSFGDTIHSSQVNFNGKYPYGTAGKSELRSTPLPVGSLAPNAWGLYDMHGNVDEWCADWYAEYPTTPQTDPKGPETGEERVRRGGGYMHFGKQCRSAYRFQNVPEDVRYFAGFRVVKK